MFVCDGLPWLQLAIQLVGHREPGLTIWTVHQPTVECRPVCEVYLQIGVLLQTLLVFFKTLGKKSQTIIILFNLGFTSLGISFKEKPHFFQTSPTLELYVEIQKIVKISSLSGARQKNILLHPLQHWFGKMSMKKVQGVPKKM